MEKNYNNLKFSKNDEVSNELQKILLDPTNRILGVNQVENDYKSDNFIEGGLVIDYCISNGENRRFIIAYTELGSWIEYHGVLELSKEPIIIDNPFE